MFASVRRFYKWASSKTLDNKQREKSPLLLIGFIGLFEDVLFWRQTWLSVSFIFCVNIIFLICVNWQVNLLEFSISVCIFVISCDAFETWLKYKHRTSFLKKLGDCNNTTLKAATTKMSYVVKRKWTEFIHLRNDNHTKAFLLVNIILSFVFVIGKYVNGYILMYIICMAILFFNKFAMPLHRMWKKIQQHADSDGELDELLPDVSDANIKLLSIEPDQVVPFDEKQSLDYWKPEDLPLEDVSDSSDSSSLVNNLSMEKMKGLPKEDQTSDSSEDDYIPLDKLKDHLLQSTLEVQPSSSWSNTAYNAFFNITGAMANMVYAPTSTKDKNKVQYKRLSCGDSTDGFEMVDKNDL